LGKKAEERTAELKKLLAKISVGKIKSLINTSKENI